MRDHGEARRGPTTEWMVIMMICVVRVGRAAAGVDVGCFGVVDEQDWGGREAERAEVWLGIDRVSSRGLTILPIMQFFSCHIF